MRRPRVGISALLAVASLACGGDGGTGPGDEGGGDAGDSRVIKADPSFSADVQEIFDRRGCSQSQCHGSARQGGLDLRSGNSHAALVGVTAQAESVVRVIPGNAQDSYLVVKLEGRQNVGGRMPEGGAPLDEIDLANIRNWIDRGAANN